MTSYEVKQMVELAQRVINFGANTRFRGLLGAYADTDSEKLSNCFLELVFTAIGNETVKLHLAQLENPTQAEQEACVDKDEEDSDP
jgi:hypothetical protein